MGRRDIDDLPDSCPYKTWSLGDLMAECKRRGIAASGGLVSRVIKRLMRDDDARAAGKQSVSKPHVRGPPRQKRAPGEAPSGRGRKKRVANPLLARRVWTVFERWQEERVHRLREEVGWQAGVTGAAWERARRAYARRMVRDARDALPPPMETNAEAEAEVDVKEEERRALMDPAVQAGFERAMLARIPVHHYAHVIAAPPPLPMQSPEHWLMSLGNAPYLSEMAVASVTDFLIYWREGLLRWAEEASGSATSKDEGGKDKEEMEEQEQQECEDQDEEDEEDGEDEEDEEKPRPADDLNVPLMIPAPPRLRRIARAPSVRERVEGLIKLVGVLGVIAESRASRALDHGASRVRWESVKGSVLGEAARLHLPVPQPGQTPAMWLEEVGRQRQVPSDVLEGFLRGWKDRVVQCLREGGAVAMAERREGGAMGGVGGEGVRDGAVGNGDGGGYGEGHARANGGLEIADSDVEMEDVSEDACKEEEEQEEATAEEPDEDEDMDETMEEEEESMDVDQQQNEQEPQEEAHESSAETTLELTDEPKKNPTPSPPPAAHEGEHDRPQAPPQIAHQDVQDDDDAEDSIVVARPPSPPAPAPAPPTLPPPPLPPASSTTTTPTTRKSTAAGRRRSGRRSAMG